MSYRDDLDASQARITALEAELAEARAHIDELEEQKASRALVKVGDHALASSRAASPRATRWLGAPIEITIEREVAGEISESAYTELVELIRRALKNIGTVSTLPGSLAWSTNLPSNGVGPFVDIYFTIRGGKTTIRAEERLGNLVGAIFGGIGGGVGVGGIMAPISTLWISPFLLPIALPLWLGGSYLACRSLFRSRARSRAERLNNLLDDLVETCERHCADALAAAAATE